MYVFSKPAAWVTPPSCSGPKRFCLNVFFKRPRFPFYISLLKGGYVQYIFCQWEAERVHVCVQFIIYCVRLSKLCSNGERINYSERERGFFFFFVLAQRPSWLNMCSSGLVGDASGWLNAGLANIRRWVLILPRGRVAVCEHPRFIFWGPLERSAHTHLEKLPCFSLQVTSRCQ